MRGGSVPPEPAQNPLYRHKTTLSMQGGYPLSSRMSYVPRRASLSVLGALLGKCEVPSIYSQTVTVGIIIDKPDIGAYVPALPKIYICNSAM